MHVALTVSCSSAHTSSSTSIEEMAPFMNDKDHLRTGAAGSSPRSKVPASTGLDNESSITPQEPAGADESAHNGGRWTKEEHEKFLIALELYGKNWKKVQQFVGTRNTTQTRSHAQKHFAKLTQTQALCHSIENMHSDDHGRLQRSDSLIASSTATAASTPHDSPLVPSHITPLPLPDLCPMPAPYGELDVEREALEVPRSRQRGRWKRVEPELLPLDVSPGRKQKKARKTSAEEPETPNQEVSARMPNDNLMRFESAQPGRAHVVPMKQAVPGVAWETTFRPTAPAMYWPPMFSTDPFASRVTHDQHACPKVEKDFFDCSELFTFARPLEIPREPIQTPAPDAPDEPGLPYVDFTNIFDLH
jgi:SHAQKYF class myb-like DNA-binding protein